MKVRLKKLNNKLAYYIRDYNNELLTASLDDLLKIEGRQVPFYSSIATREEFSRNEYSHKLQYDEHYVYLPLPLIPIIRYRMKLLGFELEVEDKVSTIDLSINEEVRNHLTEVYGEYSEKLLELLDFISSHNRGLVDLYTGYGKTWAILGLVYIFLHNNPEGKVMVIASGAAVVNEIRSRIPKFNISMDRVILENSVSLRAKRFFTEEYQETKDSIKMVIIDECDSIFETLRNFLDSVNSYESIIGFTATSDYHKGQKLDFDLDFSSLRTDVYRILAYVGHEIITMIPKNNIRLNVINANFSQKQVYMNSEFLKFKQSIKFVIESHKFIDVLVYIQKYQKDTLYILLNNRNLINLIISNAKKYNSGLEFIYWDAGDIHTTTGLKFNNHIELNSWLLSTDSKSRPNILLSTRASYRGVSLPSLTDILFVEGSNFRNVPQSVGRVMRSELPTVWIPCETSDKNIIFLASSRKRIKIMHETYPNLIKTVIDYDKEVLSVSNPLNPYA